MWDAPYQTFADHNITQPPEIIIWSKTKIVTVLCSSSSLIYGIRPSGLLPGLAPCWSTGGAALWWADRLRDSLVGVSTGVVHKRAWH